MIDTGSERETETFLQEVTDALDERALLLSSTRNQGFVTAVNQGLARSDAPHAVVLRQSSVTTHGWLGPILELADARPEAGLVVPRFSRSADGSAKGNVREAGEADHGSFSAMLIRRELYQSIGGFNPDLDGGIWCLKEYSRRALRAGYLTCRAVHSHVVIGDDPQFGSTERRAEMSDRSRGRVEAHSGAERRYCILLSPSATPEECADLSRLLLKGARQGHRIELLVPHRLSRELSRAGYGLLHDNIHLHHLPLLAAGRATRRTLERLQVELPGIVPVVAGDGPQDFGAAVSLPFPEFERAITAGLTEERCIA